MSMTTAAAPVDGLSDVRATAGRWAGWSLLLVLASLLVTHGGAQAIAGQRATGTEDIAAITAFYSHTGLRVLFWQHGAGVIVFAGFAVAMRQLLVARVGSGRDRLLLDTTVVIALAVVPAALVELALQLAMIQLASAGSADGLLAVFATWDWFYNSLFYWLEAFWMAGLGVLTWRTGILPRWMSALGLTVAAAHVFHSAVLMLGLPDAATLPATAGFIVWFAAAGTHLIRTAAHAPR